MVVHVLIEKEDVEEKCIHDFLSSSDFLCLNLTPNGIQGLEAYADELKKKITNAASSDDDYSRNTEVQAIYRLGRILVLLFARLNFFGPSCNNKNRTEDEERRIYEAARKAGVLREVDDKYAEMQIGDLLEKTFPVLGHLDSTSSSKEKAMDLEELSTDGEYMYAICPGLPYFYAGKVIMQELASAVSCKNMKAEVNVWVARICYIQQRLLHSDKWVICPSLRASCLDVSLSLLCDLNVLKMKDFFFEETDDVQESDDILEIDTASPFVYTNQVDVGSTHFDSVAILNLLFECALRLAVYGLKPYFFKVLDAVQKIMKVRYEFSGALGIGREFQKEAKSQLVVLTYDVSDGTDKPAGIPVNRAAEPDTTNDTHIRGDVPLKYIDAGTDVLERPKLEDAELEAASTNALSLDFQFLLLLHASMLKECIMVDDTLQSERLNAVVNRVIAGAVAVEGDSEYQSYSVISSALWFRCVNDIKKTNRRDRGVMQLQTLLDQFEDRKPPVSLYRMGTSLKHEYPTRIAAKEELVNYLLSIGSYNSAYEIYEDLGIHDRAAGCLIAARRVREAEEYIVQRLEKKQTEQMLCLLGDVRDDPSYYVKAWELSGGRFAGAMRHLGFFEMRHERYRGAVDAFNKALKLNNNFPQIFFNKGCLELQLQEFVEAAKSFRSCIRFDQDNAEAWANLTAVYINTNEHDKAYRAVKEAVKWGRHQWKIIDSWLSLSLKIGFKSDILSAYQTLLDICAISEIPLGKHAIAKEVIFDSVDKDKLEDVYKLLQDDPDSQVDFDFRIAVSLIEIFERILAEVDSQNIAVCSLLSDMYNDIRIPGKEYEMLTRTTIEMRAVMDRSNDQYFLDNVDKVLDSMQRAALLLRKRVDWNAVGDSEKEEEDLLADRSRQAARMNQSLLVLRERTSSIYANRRERFQDQKIASFFIDIRKVLKDIEKTT